MIIDHHYCCFYCCYNYDAYIIIIDQYSKSHMHYIHAQPLLSIWLLLQY